MHSPKGQPPIEWLSSTPKSVSDLVCVHQAFERQAHKTPNNTALELNGETLTYRELSEQSNQLARYLIDRGVVQGDLVGISMEVSFDLIVAIYGILKAGAAYVPMDSSYPRERLRYMAKTAKLKLVITEQRFSQLFHDIDAELLLYDIHRETVLKEPVTAPACDYDVNQLIYIIFTSGSTGQPKAAAVYHRGFANLLNWFVSEFEISERDHALLMSSVSFDLTQKNLYATLLAGGRLHLYPPGAYDLTLLGNIIEQQKITMVNCTPSAFYPLIQPLSDSTAEALQSLRLVFLGGEPISTRRVKPWLTHPKCGAIIVNTYGPTECTDICGFYCLTQSNLDKYDFVPLGHPIYNVQILVLRDDLSLCDIDEAGELCIGGAGVGAGYLDAPEKTAEKFITHQLPYVDSKHIYRTGDQVRWHQDGLIEFLGRIDHQVKIRGFRIELPEIERALDTHPGVKESIVVVKQVSESGDPQLICCVTFNHEELATDTLKSYLSNKLPAHMVPLLYRSFEHFPLSPNGKVDRNALTALIVQQSENTAVKKTDASSELEKIIQIAWASALNTPHPALDDNFFDLGGDSLRIAQLHQLLEKELNQKISITDLYANPTIRSMSQHFSNLGQQDSQHTELKTRAEQQRAAKQARRHRNKRRK